MSGVIDQDNTPRVDKLIAQLTEKSPGLQPLADSPSKLLEALGAKEGKVNGYTPKEKASYQPTESKPLDLLVSNTGEGHGLLDILADGADTSREFKKAKIGQPLPKRRINR